MLFRECLSMAFNALYANKMRTFLTMLGVIIGVAAVIAMVSIGMGVRSNIQSSIAELGSNMLIVSPGAPTKGGVRGAAGSLTTLKYEDAEAIAERVANVEFVSPSVSGSYQIVNGNLNWNTMVQGVSPEQLAALSLKVSSGSFITQAQMDKRERIAVVGTTVAENLFDGINPVGKNIRINGQPYKVIGLLESKGQSAVGQDQDDVVMIPITTAQERLLGIDYVRSINVKVKEPMYMDKVQEDIEGLLRQRHRISKDKEDDFHVRNLTSLLETMNQTTAMITLLLGSVAGISLVVGGIGIMNIMMVSVTERTKEIGIRKALGATYQNIMMQFLIESVVIGLIGGFIGILTGCGISKLISHVGGFTTVITLLPIGISFFFAVGTGLIFGILPARRAARMDPIDALRYE